MASFIDEMKVNTAITDNTKLDLGHQHITTANFMQLNPILCKEMVPGESCDVNLMTFSRMQPLAVPTFGRANIKERAFFVPMRTIFRGWNDFITDTPHVYSACKEDSQVNYPVVPTVANVELAKLFLTQNALLPGTNFVVGTRVTNIADITAGNYDIIGYDLNDGTVHMRLTTEGKQCLKVLESLGYKIVYDERNEDVYSAMPLLAIAKIYCDWYFPSQYVNTGIYSYIMGLLNYDDATPLTLNMSALQYILSWITYVNFDSDYFVNAWDNPVSPTNGVFSTFTFVDISLADASGQPLSSNNTSVEFSVAKGTPYMRQTASSSTNIGTQYIHDALKGLTDYMKRHQLVGARAMDRYLARFGKKLNVEQLNRCNYIGCKMIPLNVGDVYSSTSLSPTGTEYGLGQFAGKGIAFEKNFSFDWRTDEYGFLVVMSSIVPAAGIYQGIDRKIMHIGKTDFWTPEFDNLGVQAISMREVYNNYSYVNLSNSDSNYMGFDKTVFGFAPRYGEYKYANDQLTGDFNIATVQFNNINNAAENSWHLMRTFTDRDFKISSTYDYTYMPHSRNFVSGIRDHYQFDRIFNYVDPAYQPDPFTCIYDFQMVSQAPMKPLYETYEFDDKGKQVVEQSGGVKVN